MIGVLYEQKMQQKPLLNVLVTADSMLSKRPDLPLLWLFSSLLSYFRLSFAPATR